MRMVLQQCHDRNKPILIHIQPSQPSCCIKNCRSTIKHGSILQFEEHPIETIDVIKAISECCKNNLTSIQLEDAIDIKPSGTNPPEGIPQLFLDPLINIQQHIKDIQIDNHNQNANSLTTNWQRIWQRTITNTLPTESYTDTTWTQKVHQ